MLRAKNSFLKSFFLKASKICCVWAAPSRSAGLACVVVAAGGKGSA